MKKKIIVIVISLAVLAALLWGPVVSNVEQANYNIVASHPNHIELRDYKAMIVAQVTMSGQRQDAIGDGFRDIAGYIFGGNTAEESIAMTAPVTQQSIDEQQWKVHFMMPAHHTMLTLPKPSNASVSLKKLPPKRYVVIKFSGFASDANIKEHEETLRDFMEKENLTPRAEPVYAFFNPPWTLPFLKRNEVMIEIQ